MPSGLNGCKGLQFELLSDQYALLNGGFYSVGAGLQFTRPHRNGVAKLTRPRINNDYIDLFDRYAEDD